MRATSLVARTFLDRQSMGLAAVAIVLLAVLGCSIWKKAEPPLLSEIADSTVVSSLPHVPINLNKEPLGTTGDLRQLREMVRDIMQNRERNGVFREGVNEIENTVHVRTDERISVGMLADLLAAVNESGGKAYVPVKLPPESDPITRPNPQTLVLSAGEPPQLSFLRFEMSGTDVDKYAIAPSVEILSDPREIKTARAIGGSVEISANGEYFFNGTKKIFFSNTDIDEVEIVQRQIDASTLSTEVATLVVSSPIKVISSELAPATSLLKIFKAVDATKHEWKLIVRRAKSDPSHKK